MRKPVSHTLDPREGRQTAIKRPPRRRRDRALYVALVHTPREVCFVTAASSNVALERRLAEYVREHARQQLWPDDAGRVEALLDAGDTGAAIWLYFDTTGARWDEETLCIHVVEPSLDGASH